MACLWLDKQANGVKEEAEQRLASFFSFQIRVCACVAVCRRREGWGRDAVKAALPEGRL